MKSQMLLLQKHLLQDAGRIGNTSTQRDFEEVTHRVEIEGLSFLTITLPRFAKDLQKALDEGRIAPAMFAGFSRRGQLPRFLGGLLKQIFDSGSGLLLDNPSTAAIQAIRQVTMAFAKIEMECSDERRQTAYQGYVECERFVRDGDRRRRASDYDDFGNIVRLLWSDLYSRLDRRLYDGELDPSHGPGAVADKLKGNAKWAMREYSERLERIFPYLEYARANRSAYLEIDRVDFREPGRERPVKVTDVPKTQETVRIIAQEPSYMMFIQQGILRMMKDEFSRQGTYANAFICFDSQEPNQLLAQEGSATGQLATLDLKEASDRVSNQLVIKMFERFPTLGEAVQACRSRSADVPDHGVIRLAKFASMGSALTFPIEALVFCTLVFLGIEKALNRPLSRQDVNSRVGKVRIYGEDSIVPVGYVSSVIAVLEDFGLLVNRNKSYWTGSFRESCGGDFYAGMPVKVARVRRAFPEDFLSKGRPYKKGRPPTLLKQGSELVSVVSLRNQLYKLGYHGTAEWLDQEIRKVLPIYPNVTEDSPVLGRHVPYGLHDVDGRHKDEQRPLVRGYVVDSITPPSKIDGYDALLKVLSKTGLTPFEDPQHLDRAGRASAVRLKLRWSSPV
jgi:hypothetical protein